MYNKYILKYFSKNKFQEQKRLHVWSRALRISKNLVGRRVFVHAGSKFVSFLVKDVMVGYRFGQFIFTKKLGSGIHIKVKKKRKVK